MSIGVRENATLLNISRNFSARTLWEAKMSYFPNPLQQLVPQRVQATLRRIQSQIWEKRQDLEVYGGPVNSEPLFLAQAQRQSLTKVELGETFAGPGSTWQQRWFKVAIPAAEPHEKGRRVLFWDSQGETTVYLNGTPWAGIDIAHRYCTLPDDACELWLDTGTYQTAIWFGAPKARVDQYGCRFDGAWISCRNTTAWDAYWDLHCLHKLMNYILQKDGWHGQGTGLKEPLDKVPVVLRRLLRGLDAACNVLDVDGLEAAAKRLRKLYSEVRAAPWQGKAALCGHAHIDLVWLWPEVEGERKAVHSFSTVLRLMDRYPELRFTHSQPAAYKAVQRRAPQLYEQVIAKIRKGQWEATGGFETECDVNLPCGEALARSLQYGQMRFAEMRGGEISRNVWIPDVFGYSNCLPQIMKLGGITSFFTTKMTWSSVTRFPHNAFVWRGADGSEVLTFLCPVGYNGRVEFDDLTSAVEANRQSGVCETTLLPQGIGDGGGGPTEDMCERARRFADLAKVPQTQWGTVEDFFDELQGGKDELPVYQGELYLEMHRGVHTTQGQLKQRYRAAERALQAHEACRVLHAKGPVAQEDWLRLAFAQFHDALPGSSIGLVYEQLNPELEQLAQNQLAAARSLLEKANAQDNQDAPLRWHVFNPLVIPQTTVVSLPENEFADSADSTANDAMMQVNDEGQALRVVDVPGLSSVDFSDRAQSAERQSPAGGDAPGTLDNGLVQASFDNKGKLEKLCIDGQNLAITEPAGFVIYPDHPVSHDAWDIDRHTLQLGQACADDLRLQLTASGPVRAILSAQTSIGEASTMQVKYYLDAGLPYLFVELEVDWQEEHKLLKYHVLTNYQGQMSRYGAPFGSTRRPQLPGYANDESQWEVAGSRWAAVTDDTESTGLALITEAKYGFSCRAGDLGLSLLRAPKHPDSNADIGRHRIRFAIGLHRVESTEQRLSTAAAAESLYSSVIPYRVDDSLDIAPPLSLSELGSLVPSWIVPAQDGKGWILRAHETSGISGSALMNLRDKPARVKYVDFLENEMGDVRAVGARAFRLDFKPYQILSVYVG